MLYEIAPQPMRAFFRWAHSKEGHIAPSSQQSGERHPSILYRPDAYTTDSFHTNEERHEWECLPEGMGGLVGVVAQWLSPFRRVVTKVPRKEPFTASFLSYYHIIQLNWYWTNVDTYVRCRWYFSWFGISPYFPSKRSFDGIKQSIIPQDVHMVSTISTGTFRL